MTKVTTKTKQEWPEVTRLYETIEAVGVVATGLDGLAELLAKSSDVDKDKISGLVLAFAQQLKSLVIVLRADADDATA